MDVTPLPTCSPIRRRRSTLLAAAVAASALGALAPSGVAHAANLPAQPKLVSRSSADAVSGSYSNFADISGDGRFVVFVTSGKLVPEDTNSYEDVYVRDRWAGTTERVSVNTAGVGANASSGFPAISDDGRRIVFVSGATNLGGTETKGFNDVFVRDRTAGTTTRVSVSSTGGELDGGSGRPDISGNGRYVAFDSGGTTLVPNDTNGEWDIFVRDLQNKTNERESVTSAEGQAFADNNSASISDDGRYVAFVSAEELAGGLAGDGRDVFVRDRTNGTTVNANLSSTQVQANGNAWPPLISGNGRYVVFGSDATNLVTDTNGQTDAYRRDLVGGTTVRVTLADDDSQLPAGGFARGVSDDGTQVEFDSTSPATTGDAGTDQDVFVRNVASASTRRLTTSPTNLDPAGFHAVGGGLSDDGSAATFDTSAPLVAGHANGDQVYATDSTRLGPLATLTAFIDQQYADFVGRAPTAAERADWQAKIQDGRSHPAAMIAELAQANAFSKDRAPVTRLYWAFFLRKPDPSGLTYWINRHKAGVKLSTIAQGFANSSEFQTRYGSLTNEQFVAKIYPNIFERQPDASGLAYWTGKLDRKEKTRGDVMVGFSESSEGVRRLAPQVGITLISQGMLRTSPSAAYWDAAFARFKGGEKELAWLAQTTLTSVAYDARL